MERECHLHSGVITEIENNRDWRNAHIKEHQAIHKKLDELVESVRNRLPVWATLLIGVLMAAIGWLAAMARLGG